MEVKEKTAAKPAANLVLAAVESSNVASTGYCPDTKILAVRFKNGGTYLYAGVALDIWTNMQKAESVGKFMNEFIKPKHACTKFEV